MLQRLPLLAPHIYEGPTMMVLLLVAEHCSSLTDDCGTVAVGLRHGVELVRMAAGRAQIYPRVASLCQASANTVEVEP